MSSLASTSCHHVYLQAYRSQPAQTAVPSSGQAESNDESWAQIRAYRQLLYNRMQRQLAKLRENAALRSGARGSQARKELLAFEKRVEEAKDRYKKIDSESGNLS